VRALRELILLPLHLYRRVVSPALRPHCKYHPSCSEYAVDAVRTYGIARGSLLAAWRVLRCNPWSRGGIDPVARQAIFRPRAAR
jgi:putative membrane protein insertion efficiency factor